ncbi:hypothetical protein CLF_102128 [Clonorchis sinensis]|uniref:Uncharacterized protein n=1 Tax=Clonorchis sinensis TaxID=79923 RepID=G7Y7C8_CLOSI|nr:hypothetical protein CLF_102128 [Clonorchis sinensis]
MDETQSISIHRAFVVDKLSMRAVPSSKEVASSLPQIEEVPIDELAEDQIKVAHYQRAETAFLGDLKPDLFGKLERKMGWGQGALDRQAGVNVLVELVEGMSFSTARKSVDDFNVIREKKRFTLGHGAEDAVDID